MIRKEFRFNYTTYLKDGVEVAPGNVSDYEFNITKAGWNYLGVVSFAINAGGSCTTVSVAQIDGSTVRYRIRNNGSATLTPQSVIITCLYYA